MKNKSNRSKDILRQVGALGQQLQQRDEKEIRDAVARAKKSLRQMQRKKLIKFPVDAFPKTIQQILLLYQETYRFPVDYYGLGVLIAASTSIGNSYVGQYFPGWRAPSLLYGIIIAGSGVGKSQIMQQCLLPILDIQRDYDADNAIDRAQWELECERLDQQKNAAPHPPPPPERRIVTSNVTVEGIYPILSNNPRGILLKRDELKGFVSSMNQYRKGGDAEFWLEVFDNGYTVVDRVTKSFRIPRTFINIFGCMQPGVTKVLAKDGGRENGFIARFLFAYPDNLKKPLPADPEEIPDLGYQKTYARIIKYLNDLPSKIHKEEGGWRIDSVVLPMSIQARRLFYEFLKSNTEEQNKESDDFIKAIYAKMDTYLLRLALILELLDFACTKTARKEQTHLEEVEQLCIRTTTLSRAMKLIAYFKMTALKLANKLGNPVNRMAPLKAVWYRALKEDSFSTAYAEQTGRALGIGRSTIYTYLNDSEIFTRHRRGQYEKKYV
ncbi:MAG: DUF3987 domain-containing protein [Bacteroidota bacterium]